MKRFLSGLLCVCILLSGCAGGPHQLTQTDPLETQTQPSAPAVPLLEQGVAVGESGNLLYIPNDDVEDMVCPEVWLYGNGLLFGSHIRDKYVLRHISLEDGRLLAEYEVSASPGVRVCIGTGCVGLLDSGTNRLLLLNDDLTVKSSQAFQTEGDSWFLSPGLDRLYRFYSDKGLLARDLQSGEEYWIVENAVFTRVIGAETEYVLFEYTDVEDQRTDTCCLNLSDGTIEMVPDFGPISTGIRLGETWLMRKDGENGAYILYDGDFAASFVWTESAATILSPRRDLLLTDHSGRTLYLYDPRGRFVSTCTLRDAEYGTVGMDLIWSEYWGGYFFTDTVDGICHLVFWDIDEQTQGDDLELIPLKSSQTDLNMMEKAFYERAEKLSSRFGVKILIAEQCVPEYSHYNSYHLSDPGFVGDALDILEECLGRYPEGFFRQLPYGTMNHIQIELIGGLALKDGVENQPDTTVAFVQDRDGYINIVIDGFMIEPETVYHEFTHVIDRRLSWDALVRNEALFSEEHWLSLQPDGFAYAMSYTDMPEDTHQYAASGYFVRDYSMTYPTEDRATLFAAAMTQAPLMEESPGMQKKLDYYARCIRDCFDTEGWPEVTAWELILK